MFKIINKVRHDELVMREKLFLNPNSDNPSYEELVEIHDRKLDEIKDIQIRLKNMRQTFTTIMKQNGRTLRQYKKKSK